MWGFWHFATFGNNLKFLTWFCINFKWIVILPDYYNITLFLCEYKVKNRMTENTGYFRIDEPPQQNPYPRIKSNSSQPNIYQQAPPYQPYANQAYQPYYNINQPPPPPYNAQGFNPNINHINEERLNVISEEAVLSKNATKIIWISLIVFI